MRHLTIVIALLLGMFFAQSHLSHAKPGDPSLSTLADRALVSGDLPMAKDLYKKWLEADPSDYVSWYNYACTQALLGDTVAALGALESACTAGWTDSAWTAGDPDLLTIRGTEKFNQLVTRMAQKAALVSSSQEDGERRYFERNVVEPCLLIQPEGIGRHRTEHPPLVLLLHDRGQNINDMKQLVDRLALPGILYAIPRAPYPVDEARGGFEYWPREVALTGEAESAAHVRSLTAAWYSQLVNDIAASEDVDTNRVYIVGYAQGAAAALLAALEAPQAFAGVATLAGYLPESHRDSTMFKQLHDHGTRLFIGHGSRDREVTKSEAAIIDDFAEQAGMDVTYRMYPAEHEISDVMVLDLGEWLNNQIHPESGETQQP